MLAAAMLSIMFVISFPSVFEEAGKRILRVIVGWSEYAVAVQVAYINGRASKASRRILPSFFMKNLPRFYDGYLDTPLRSGDQVISTVNAVPPEEPEPEEPEPQPELWAEPVKTADSLSPREYISRDKSFLLQAVSRHRASKASRRILPSFFDFEKLDGPLVLQVNGADCPFTQELSNNDQVTIRRGH